MTSFGTHVAFFLIVSLLTSLVTMSIRLRNPRTIAKETARLFLQIVVGIFLFCGVVFVVEWVFVRPLI
jgi:hypothetical protein